MTRRAFFSLLFAPLLRRLFPPAPLSVDTFCDRYLQPAVTALANSVDQPLFCVGDVITIAGKYAVNPVTRAETEALQLFVVTRVHESSVELWPRVIENWDAVSPAAVSPVLLGSRVRLG
jgi:hypothetical protein